MLRECYEILDRLRLPHGLYMASPSEHYCYVWIRDSFYMSLPYLDKPGPTYEAAYHRFFDLLKEYEWKLDIHTWKKPNEVWEYLHARYTAEDVKEIHHEEWGHVQHDMIGAVLYGIGEGCKAGKGIIRDEHDLDIVQKLVDYLECVEYWHDPDNGMWEEWRELHASSIGACVAGLKAVEELVQVPDRLIENGLTSLLQLYPRESESRPVDLAQMSLIYPYRLFSKVQGEVIVSRIEQELLRERGVIRYPGDSYYSTVEEEHGRGESLDFYYGTEAEWTFGFPWLALCYYELGHLDKAREWLKRSEEIVLEPGVFPELYYSGTNQPNPNTPLGWSCAMYILAKEKIDEITT